MVKIKETDLALKVVDYLSSQHWDVYQEVKIINSVADIVAVQGPLVWIIECKLSFSLGLIGQAFEWRNEANLVSVAVPKEKNRYRSKARHAGINILRHYGIGLLEIKNLSGDINNQTITISPNLNRKAHTKRVKDSLNEKQKYWVPAGSQSGCWTPFKQTCQRIIRIVNKNPGISLKDLIDKISHHYYSDASAKSSISHWIKGGKIKGVVCKRDGRYLKFYPDLEKEVIE